MPANKHHPGLQWLRGEDPGLQASFCQSRSRFGFFRSIWEGGFAGLRKRRPQEGAWGHHPILSLFSSSKKGARMSHGSPSGQRESNLHTTTQTRMH